MSTESTYYDGRTMEQVAKDWRDRLVTEASTGELNSESGYGSEATTVVRITLAGGGPACYVEFDLGQTDPEYWFEPDEVRSGNLTYLEPWKPSVTVDFADEDAEAVFQALTTPPE